MLKNPCIGDRVKWINQPWSGIIKELQGQRALIILKDGFEEWAHFSILVSDQLLPDKLDIQDKKNMPTYVETRPLKVSEIDLHLENLFVHWKKIPQEKILDYQLQAFHEEYQECLKNSIDELIVIHGKGKGILKENLVKILREKKKINFEYMQEGKYKQSAIKIVFSRN